MLRLPRDPVIRPEDIVAEGPNVEYNEEVKVTGGGKEKRPHLVKLFEELPLHKKLKRNLHAMGFVKLRQIQQYIIPFMSQGPMGKDIIACARTGHGKTVSYLISLIDKCAVTNASIELSGSARKPRAIVLLKSHEIAGQVYNLACKMAADTNVLISTSMGFISYNSEKAILEREGGDIIVATTGRFYQHVNENRLNLNHVDTVIYDEGDQLVDNHWQELTKIIDERAPLSRQTICISSTFNHRAMAYFEGIMRPHYWFIDIGAINKIEKNVLQVFLDYPEIQHSKLIIDILKQHAVNEQCPKTIVFTNSANMAHLIAARLRLFNDVYCPFQIRAACLHSKYDQIERNVVFTRYTLEKEEPYALDVLVSCDVLSYGINTSTEIVINYEVPSDLVKYTLRVGRTGRNGHKGIAYTLCDSNKIINMKGRHEVNLAIILQAAHKAGAYIPKKLQPCINFASQCYHNMFN